MSGRISRTSLRIVVAVMCLSLMAGLSACAKSEKPKTHYNAQQMKDPIEPVNRFIFGFNNIIDKCLIEPVARVYRAVLPPVVRDGIQNFMRNLQSPLIVANNILQGEIGDAGKATARFVINSTVGVAGLVDVAKSSGFEYDDEDFGQTLATWGVGDGFYIVLPILGPSSLRDTGGLAVDTVADPLRLLAHNTDNMWIYYTRGAIEGMDTRARMIPAIDDMRRNSLDYYAAVRSAYAQKRLSLINDENPETKSTAGYDEFK